MEVICDMSRKLTTDEFIDKAINIHGDKYDYSLVEYTTGRNKVKIICKKHGVFKQKVDAHLNGQGCSKCRMVDKDQFIKRANKIHLNNYDYQLISFNNTYEKVNIICPVHGIYSQRISSHLDGQGCPKCMSSKGERSIMYFLDNIKIKYKHQYKFKDCVHKKPLIFDFYLPEYNISIEYNGKQHYESIDFYGGIKEFEKRKIRDNIKEQYCLNNNIELIIIKYDESIN